MKTDIHPQYFEKAKITCACGAKYTMGSTVEELHVELCAACHPFYTGKQKLVDTAGRVDRFKKKMELKSTKAEVKGKKIKKAAQLAKKTAKAKKESK